METPNSPFPVHSCYRDGTLPGLITIEYHARFQIPGFQILGLPAPEVREARERILSAFPASGLEFPKKKVTINLAPSAIPKWGTGHDLPIAIRILSETLSLPAGPPVLALGELGLDGSVKPVGCIALLIELLRLHSPPEGYRVILAPEDHDQLLQLLDWMKRQGLEPPSSIRLSPLSHLSKLPGILRNIMFTEAPASVPPLEVESSLPPYLLPPGPGLERILLIASVGRHHTLLLGPKGIGKSESLAWFRLLAGKPDPRGSWERILHQESRGETADPGLPLRRVHSEVKPAHLLGSFGIKGYRAGELALAHGGLLLADEFLEWSRDAKECLREPLQTGTFRLTRARGSIEVPCDLQFIATGNLCPCGGFPAELRSLSPGSRIRCRCSRSEVHQYLSRLSGPILDRIDLPVILPDREVPPTEAPDPRHLVQQVTSARRFALEHFGELPSKLKPTLLEAEAEKSGVIQLLGGRSLSLRGRTKSLRLAKSIQALEQSPCLERHQVLEALSLRQLDETLIPE
jgi:magnesium chelatase family protein